MGLPLGEVWGSEDRVQTSGARRGGERTLGAEGREDAEAEGGKGVYGSARWIFRGRFDVGLGGVDSLVWVAG